MMEKEFATNTNTIETMRQLFFPDIACVRIDDSFPDGQYSTDLLEADIRKLHKMMGLGRESFHKYEKEVKAYLEDV